MRRKLRHENILHLPCAGPPVHTAGFSLLEVMICMVVLTVAISIFLASIAKNVQLEAMNSETNIALNAASDVIETARSLDYGEVNHARIPATFEASGLGNDGHTVTLINTATSTQVGQVTITEDVGQTTKTVHVRVLWRSITGSERSVVLMTEVTSY